MDRIVLHLIVYLSILVIPVKLRGEDKQSSKAENLCEKLALNIRTPLKSSHEYLIHKISSCVNLMGEDLNLQNLYFYFVDDSDENYRCALLKSFKSKSSFTSDLQKYHQANTSKLEPNEGFKVLCDGASLEEQEGVNPILRAPGLSCSKQPYGGWNCTETLQDPRRIY